MVPLQGATNEEVVHRIYATLNSEGNRVVGASQSFLVHWKGSDQTYECGPEELRRCVSLRLARKGMARADGGICLPCLQSSG
ncbi:hypothetical protein BC827DRAFT_1241403 [Russula dissimulans]|jgi:hypothetical protein|nr:hypothetical protein BC827DRAFT_1241403 [Russula dissimulans]